MPDFADEPTIDAGGPPKAAPDLTRTTPTGGTADVPELPPRYAVGELLGRGGMGGVWKVHDSHLGRDLAAKVLLADLKRHDTYVARFLAEARIHSRLQHPGIAPLHDLGEMADGRPFFTMKLVEGRTLAESLADRADSKAELPRFVQVFEQVCQAVGYAHEHGIIHRDLKPANVMVGAFGEVQVMDWGLAKNLSQDDGIAPDSLGDTSLSLGEGRDDPDSETRPSKTQGVPPDLATRAGSVLGTLSYMPPEQARGKVAEIDRRSDVFSLGAILCVILTGEPPYTGRTTSEIEFLAGHGNVSEAMGRLDACGADAELITLAKECLHPKRDRRPATAGEVAGRVAAYQDGVAERLRQAELARVEARERRKRRWQVGLAATLLVMIGVTAAAGWWWQQRRDAQRRDAQRQDIRLALDLAEDRQRESDWPGANAALEQAAGRLGDAEFPDLQDRLARDRANLALVADLDAAEMASAVVVNGSFDSRGAVRAYADIFREAGFDLSGDAEDAAERVRTSPIKERLVTALEDWALSAKDTGDRESWRRLLSLAERADPDAGLRSRLRDPEVLEDLTALRKLAEEIRKANVPPQVFILAGWAQAAQAINVKLFDERGEMTAEVIRTFRAGRDRHPDNFWLNLTLGNALLKSFDPDEALVYYQSAMALRPDSFVVLVNLSEYYRDRHDLDRALELAERAVAVAPGYASPHLELACVLLERGRADEGLRSAEKAVRLEPENSFAHVALSWALCDTNSPEAAADAARRAIELNPDDPYAYINLCSALDQMGRYPEAAEFARKAIELDPTEPLAHNNLASSLADAGEFDGALIAAREAVRLDPDMAASHATLCYVLQQRGEIEEATRAGERAVELQPDNANAHTQLATALLTAGQAGEALPHAERAVELAPDFAAGHGNLCWAYTEAGELDKAVRAGRRGAELDLNNPWILNNLGYALGRQGELEDAALAYCRAGAAGPAEPQPRESLGDTLFRQGQPGSAAAAYAEAIRLQPGNSLLHAKLCEALVEADRSEEAVAAGREAVRLSPEAHNTHYAVGLALFDLGRFDEARAAFVRTKELTPAGQLLTAAQVINWISLCERWAKLQAKLPDVMAGEAEPADAAEARDMALHLATIDERYRDSAGLYARAFTQSPELADDTVVTPRLTAARSAAAAASGMGVGADDLTDAGRAELRGRALAWLRAELAAGRTDHKTLAELRYVPELAGVRDPDHLPELPPAERAAWAQFWADFDDAIRP